MAEWKCAGCELETDDWDVMDAHALEVAENPRLLAAHKGYIPGFVPLTSRFDTEQQ